MRERVGVGTHGNAARLALHVGLAFAVLLLGLALPGCSSGKVGVENPPADGQDQGQGTTPDQSQPPDSTPAPPAVPVFDPNRETVIKRGNPDRPMVAITIDDGWNKDDRILDLLESYGIRCTVFVVGGRGVAESNPQWIARMDRAGFEVCSHTYDHYKLTDHPFDYVLEDIVMGQDVIAAVTGKRYPYMRPSGGSYNETTIEACRAAGCYLVMWSNSTGDTGNGVTVEQEVAAVLNNLKNGDIILCHFGGHNTYEVLKRIIPEIKSRGFQIGTLTEVLAP
jgi:peptidoglycan/xylan/chitin deacetylase (PgdA/CDA1 family)